jgi:chromosome transmission fidelity protein 18
MGKATGIVGVAEAGKRSAMNRLRSMIDASGEIDRIVSGES